MIIGNSLVTIPFISNTDSTRIQMSSKQLAQALTHLNCERPYTIGSCWYYLTNTTRMFREEAKENGSIIYINDDIMIVIYYPDDLKIYNIPKYMTTSKTFCSRLRYVRSLGSFEKGDILFEYDNFIQGIPSYGYNVDTMFFPFFGYNFEDCMVISESLSNRIRSQRMEVIELPIYNNSLFSELYPDSKYGFIPEIGQSINNNIVAISTNSNIFPNLYDLVYITSLNNSNNLNYIISRLENARVFDIKIHQITKNPLLIDIKLKKKIELLKSEYYSKIERIATEVNSLLGSNYTKKILFNYYVVRNSKITFGNINNFNNLAYVIELKLIKDDGLYIGDKLTNRYANKGVIGLILPDELRPIDIINNRPIDLILGPLSIYSRSNFGMVLEGLLNKTIKKCEEEILKNNDLDFTKDILYKLANISLLLNNKEYSDEIINLANNLTTDFIDSIFNYGMYYEVKNFVQTDVYKLQETIKEYFGVETNTKILMKKELYQYMKNLLGITNVKIPDNDLILDNIYNAPFYIYKLENIAESKFSARDIGDYSKASKQPIKNIYGKNKGSHLGTMEFDALIAHNNLNSIKEFRNIKSDTLEYKINLNTQIINYGFYKMPDLITNNKSYTKMIINSLMKFLNNN